MRVGVIKRKGRREEDVELFSRFFDVVVAEIPADLPEFIEDPSSYLNFPNFRADMIVSFAKHPDINLEIVRRAKEFGARIVVISGGSDAGSYVQLKEEGEKSGVRVIWEEICCATPKIDDECCREFFDRFGAPELEVKVKSGIVEDVKVTRSAFCGATYFVAEKIKGLSIDEAPSKAGYFTQIYPCLASRGLEGGIHRAARAHKSAVEKAIERALKG